MPQAQNVSTSHPKPLVAVVDDVQADREALRQLLAEEGIDSVGFMAADELIRAMGGLGDERTKGAMDFDAIFMDDVMPGVSPYAACQAMSKHPWPRCVPVVIAGQRSQPSDKAWAIKCGAKAVIVKPVSARDLREAILACGSLAAAAEAGRIASDSASPLDGQGQGSLRI